MSSFHVNIGNSVRVSLFFILRQIENPKTRFLFVQRIEVATKDFVLPILTSTTSIIYIDKFPKVSRGCERTNKSVAYGLS